MPVPSLLLIEDNPDDVALAQRALKQRGVKVLLNIATSGKEAMELLDARENDKLPKAVFLDLNMPGWHGFDVLKRVRENSKMAALPVVVLTTSNEPSDIERSYELGANSFVIKPLDFSEFSDVFAKMSAYWLGINQTV
jgi:two-component system response regulator